ncbi:MAG: YggU family protein [Candidatus Methanofastidiosum sp.]|nr:YggU family protein [Methanofastidiosum sp.]
MLEALKESRGGTIIEIEVVANSSEFHIEYNEWSKRIRLKITSPAIKGQANKEILAYFKGIFGNATIVKGEHNKKKSIFVNSTLEEVSNKLSKILK